MNIKLEVVIKKKIYYKNGWGIFGCEPKNKKDQDKVELHPDYRNFSIKGNVMELVEGEVYTVELGEIERSPKGDSYPLLKLHMPKNTSSKTQFMFLKSIMTEKQFRSFTKLYPMSGKEKVVDMIKSGEIDLAKVKGIGERYASVIKERITRQEEKIHVINKLQPLGVTEVMIDKIIDYFESVPKTLKKINESIYNLCEVDGLGFTKVDAYALKGGEDKTGSKRIEACVNFLIHKFANDGHSWTSVEEMVNEAVKLLEIDGSYVENFLSSLDEEGFIQRIEDRITSRYYYSQELGVFKHLKRINDNYKKVQFSDDELNNIIKDVELGLGLTFSEEQRFTILDSFNYGVYIINGKSGTGKSTIMKGITEICDRLNLSYRAIALSGRASQLLSLKGIEASTIHRLLGYDGDGFAHNEEMPFIQDVIILEEASMVNAYLWNCVVQATRNGAKLIIVGDSGQLSGIGYGDVLRDLLQTKVFAGNELQQIHRQAQGSGIIEVASLIRDGQQIVQYTHNGNSNVQLSNTYGENKDLSIYTFVEKEELLSSAYSVIKRQMEKLNSDSIMDFQILTTTKQRGELGTVNINKYCQKVYVGNVKGKKVSNSTYDFHVGDKVIVSGNKYGIPAYKTVNDFFLDFPIMREDGEIEEYDLFNGTMGIVEELSTDEKHLAVIVKFEGIEGYIAIQSDQLSNIELAYAITTHRSQGMSIPNTLTLIDSSGFMLLSRQLTYTSITRASKKAVLLAEHNALHTSIKKDASGLRRTFLKDLLDGTIKP